MMGRLLGLFNRERFAREISAVTRVIVILQKYQKHIKYIAEIIYSIYIIVMIIIYYLFLVRKYSQLHENGIFTTKKKILMEHIGRL